MSRMLDPLRQTLSWQRAGENGPPVDLYETDKAVIIRLAIPGGDGGALTLPIARRIRSRSRRDACSARRGTRWRSGRTADHASDPRGGVPASVGCAASAECGL